MWRRQKLTHLALITILTVLPLSPAFAAPTPEKPTVTATISVDRRNIFENEIFTLSLIITNTGVRLSQERSFSNFSPDNKLELIGDFTNFRIRPSVSNRKTDTIEKFVTQARIRRSGEIRIAPNLHAKRLVRRRSFFGTSYRTVPYVIQINPLKLSIHKIPEKDKPLDFSGAVGKCSFDVNISPTTLSVGELITATMSIRSKDHLDDIPIPAISPGRHFKAYPAKLIENESSNTSKTYKQILVPQSTNAVTISTISFSYFDPRAQSYKTITRGPFALHFQTAEQDVDIPYKPPVASNTPAGSLLTEDEPTFSEHPPAQTKDLLHTSKITSLLQALRLDIFSPPTAIAIKSGTARIAPYPASLKSFEVKRGEELYILEKQKNWYKIEIRNKRAWIPAHTLNIPLPSHGE
ncbi:MAG: BatD family protein [Kiritimatiellae bacterium]|nr:BatD family protein [Kiritimatiellia bacterium]